MARAARAARQAQDCQGKVTLVTEPSCWWGCAYESFHACLYCNHGDDSRRAGGRATSAASGSASCAGVAVKEEEDEEWCDGSDAKLGQKLATSFGASSSSSAAAASADTEGLWDLLKMPEVKEEEVKEEKLGDIDPIPSPYSYEYDYYTDYESYDDEEPELPAWQLGPSKHAKAATPTKNVTGQPKLFYFLLDALLIEPDRLR